VYQGVGTSYGDTGVVIGVGYYYSIWANHGSEGYSPVSNASATAGIEIHHPTEEFTGTVGDSNDLSYLTITYTPIGSTGYSTSAVSAYTWPVAPGSQTLLSLPDDGYVQINLSGGETVPLYGVNWSNFFVCSNGRVTFGGGSGQYAESLADHFAYPSVAAMFHDLNPTSGGNIRAVQLADRAVVTFDNVLDYWTLEPNSFQYEFFFNGTIRVTYLQMGTTAGIAGVSPGTGVPFGFAETDLSEGAVILPVPIRVGAIALAAIALAMLGAAAVFRRRRTD
jgi:hypothetical protein